MLWLSWVPDCSSWKKKFSCVACNIFFLQFALWSPAKPRNGHIVCIFSSTDHQNHAHCVHVCFPCALGSLGGGSCTSYPGCKRGMCCFSCCSWYSSVSCNIILGGLLDLWLMTAQRGSTATHWHSCLPFKYQALWLQISILHSSAPSPTLAYPFLFLLQINVFL